MIVAVCNTKGGVGKTTLALNLAAVGALAGDRVLAIDGDRQGSLSAALANRDVVPVIDVAQLPDGNDIIARVDSAKGEYKHLVIDAGGRDNSALRAALMVADVVVVPFQPRSFDVWALDDMAVLIEEARAVRAVRAIALLTMADPRGSDNDDAGAAIPPTFERVAGSIGRRKAFADAASIGKSVLETGKDAKAIDEIRYIFNVVFQ
jgi:chromosome partitioning protein